RPRVAGPDDDMRTTRATPSGAGRVSQASGEPIVARRVPIAVQLYSLREALIADPRGTIQRVAEKGYDGVEPFGLTPASARQQKALFDEFGLRVPSVHAPLHIAEKADMVLEVADILGCERVV